MATVEDIITDALEITGLKDPNDPLETTDITLGLRRINSILDGWNVNKIRGYGVQELEFQLTPQKKTYTIGPGGDFDTERPVKIENAFTFDSGNVNYPIKLVNFIDYHSIQYPENYNSFPVVLWYNPLSPLAEITLYPIPASNYTLHLDVYFGFAPYASETDTVVLPQGYEKLLIYQLSIEMCSHYGKVIPKSVMQTYRMVERDVESVNLKTWMPRLNIMAPNTAHIIQPNRTFIPRGI